MYKAITQSQIFVLDQDEALECCVGKLGLEVAVDSDLGFMRWCSVQVPGEPGRQLILERPGAPAMDEETAEQVRLLLTKGAAVPEHRRRLQDRPDAGRARRGHHRRAQREALRH